MVNLLKGGLANANLEKRELELGDHYLGTTPKYKQRKVSAVRDFPNMCGPNAFPNAFLVHSNAGGNDAVTIENASVCVEIEPQSTKPGIDSVVETAVAFATHVMQDFIEEMKIDVHPVGLSSPMLIDGHLVDGVDSSKDLPVMELEVIDSLNLDKRNPLGLHEKFCRRRVSAIRDFPSFCGPNVFGPTGQTLSVDLRRDGSVASSVSNVEITLTETENHGRQEFLEGDLHASQIEKSEPKYVVTDCAEKSMFLDSKHNDGNQASVGKEKVLHSQYRNQERKSSETVSGTVFEDVREVVNGMMAGPYCPWKQEKSPSSNSLVVLHSQDRNQERTSSETTSGTAFENVREVVHGMMAEPYCPWKQEKSPLSDSLGVMKDNKMNKETISWRGTHKAVAKKSNFAGDLSKRNSFSAGKIVDGSPGSNIGNCNRAYDTNRAKHREAASSFTRASSKRIDASFTSHSNRRNHDEISPPFTSKSSSSSDARKKVKDALHLFQLNCKKLLQEQEAKSELKSWAPSEKVIRRVDLKAAQAVKDVHKEVNKGKIIAEVPGVEVGDEFQYRVELALVGLHHKYQDGIEYKMHEGKLVAISIVASGAYADDMDNPDVLIYSGQGGNLVGKNKNPEDQKLVTGNLALKNSISERNYVRVIRGSKECKASHSSGARDKLVTTYVYDGLYTVDRYYTETGKHGKKVFMFELRRKPGQPELSWKEVKLSKKYQKRQGVCVEDISGGKEPSPVCAVNTLTYEKPPSFTYITKMRYPDWFRPSTAKGCDCTGRCSSSRKCSCAVKNGGDIPYNYNGAIVEAKPIVFECGPWCKCPPSCYNRVSQRGLSIQLEIFKTKSRGWGVRSLSFIPSGSFICEYTGELLEESEAEQRTNKDEYLFDIGHNGNNSKTRERNPIDAEEEEGGYTIDAARYGNVGRFINHSCVPNLYAQDVLYDHEDPRMPHVMLFAIDNIPCLQELTYHYNYSVDQVHDSNGNVKVKNCFCGSTVCTGRMY